MLFTQLDWLLFRYYWSSNIIKIALLSLRDFAICCTILFSLNRAIVFFDFFHDDVQIRLDRFWFFTISFF